MFLNHQRFFSSCTLLSLQYIYKDSQGITDSKRQFCPYFGIVSKATLWCPPWGGSPCLAQGNMILDRRATRGRPFPLVSFSGPHPRAVRIGKQSKESPWSAVPTFQVCSEKGRELPLHNRLNLRRLGSWCSKGRGTKHA